MVGHDAPNALERNYTTQRTESELEMDRRIIGQLVTELREALVKIRALEEALREHRQA